jgi:F-type H+-transporting ATPase subunit b
MHLLAGALIDLDWTLLVQVFLFLLAFLMLRGMVFRPVLRAFDERQSATVGRRQEAKEMESEAARKAERFDEALRKLRVAAAEERERLRQDGLRLERTILERVRADTQRETDEAERDLERQARAVRREMDTAAPALARDIAGKFLKREVK